VAIELPVVLALAPVLWFPTFTRLVVVLIVPMLWLGLWSAGGRPIPRTPLNGPLALLLAMVGVSVFATFDLAFSLGKVSGVVLGVLLFWAVARWVTSSSRFRSATTAFVLAGAGLAVVALLGADYSRFGPKFPGDPGKIPMLAAIARGLPQVIQGVPGAESGFNPNAVAGCLVLFIPLQIALLAGRADRWWTSSAGEPSISRRLVLIQAVLLVLTLGTLILMQSRGAFAGLAAAAGAVCLWHGRRSRLLVVGILVAMAALTVTFPESRLGLALSPTGPGLGRTVSDRVEFWSSGLRGIRDYPLTGMGMNTFRKLMPVRYASATKTEEEGEVPHAHNHLIQAALDLGIPGLIAYGAIWITAGGLLVSVYRRASAPIHRTIASGLGAGLVAHFVFGIADVIPLGAKVGVLFWLTLALTVTLHQTALPRSVRAQD
jgi:putative inorganic carbon (HCO3(-)) transporter